MSKSTRGRRAGIASLATTALLVSGLTAFAGPASASEPVELDRVKGDDRYGTSVAAAKAFGTSEEVILASGENGHYVDALSSNFLAGVVETPILLTKENKLPPVVKQQLEDGNYSTVHIIGGDGAVSEAVADEVRDTGATVNRIAGSNRYRTNVDVIEAGDEENSETALIATGVNFPDALGAGPVAYAGKHPIGLTKTDDIPDFVVDALKSTGVNKAIIVGGEAAVGSDVERELEAKGIDVVERLSGGEGGNRETTSIAVREFAIENLGFSESEVDFASGRAESEGVDALSGGPVSGKDDVAILITASENRANRLVAYLEENCEKADEGEIYGGEAAVSAALETELEEAMECDAAQSATSRPELRSAEIVETNTAGELGADGTTVRYTFDEAIQTATGGFAPNPGLFHLYNQAGFVDSGDSLVSQSGNTVTIFFSDADLDTDAEAAALTLATVDEGAVEDLQDQVNPEGDAPLGTTTGGGTTTLPAGVTEAPDLTAVGGFASALGGTATDVEFTFDEAADVLDPTAFTLIANDGTEYVGDATVSEGGTTVIIRFVDGVINRANIVRGAVDAGGVREQTDNEGSGDAQDENVLQAADVNNSGNSDDPDLVSVQLQEGPTTGADRVLYTFDEAVDSYTLAGFQLYYPNATEVATATAAEINGANPREVLVTFPEDTINTAVGASVLDGAVNGVDGNDNQQDEVGVANTGTTAGRTAGRTDGPDLTAVALANDTNNFGTVVGVLATYTFDEALDESTTPTAGKFDLYLANGTKLTADACEIDDKGTAAATDDTTVVCEFDDDGTGNVSRALAATLGTVDDDAVVADDGGITNPEGAEFTTGGNGTPTN